jgi:tRNA(fMet)-specific endonuclease VapC
MTRYLLDTGVAGAYADNRHPVMDRAREAAARGDRVGICTPVLGELWAGVEMSTSRERNLRSLRIALASWTVWPYTHGAAEEFGRLRSVLRRASRSMQQIDIMIAAIALSLGNCTVVTTDSDLSAVPGLAVENWAS